METDVLKKHVEDWAETFYGIIPEDCLHQSYIAAKRNPDRRPEDARFPIKDTEVLQAWYRIKASRLVARPQNSCDMCRLHSEQPEQFHKCQFHQNQPIGSQAQVIDAPNV